MKTLEKIFADKLLKIKAIKLQPDNPFTWASGWKSPFYCDNRKTLSYPDLRSFVKLEITRVILENFDEVDAIAGVVENLIEGELKPGMKVVVVEDLISTGGSSLKAVDAIRNNGCEVIGMVASFTYGFDVAKEAFKAAKVKLITLTNYEAVLDVALKTQYITEAQVPVLDNWRKDPANWKK